MYHASLEKYDPGKMHEVYNMWPEVAKKSYDLEQNVVDHKNIDHIVFSGMGGSGAIGDIFSSILSKTDIHVNIVKGYHLPKTVDSHTLLISSSISGNTSETLAVLKAATKSACKIIAFSSGGKIEQYCKKNKIDYRNIPQLHSPRASFTTYLYHMLKILGPIIPISTSDVYDSIIHLNTMQKKISSSNLTDDNPSFSLARWLTGIPMIYYPWGLQAAAIRFKSSLQENAKFHAMAEDVLEASHNGIVAWEKSKNIKPILLEGANDYIKTKERWKIIKEYFEKNKIDYKEVFSVKGSILSKLICLIYMLDYATIYLAILNKTDPSPTKSIDFIKNRI